jgi:hypothetical protein
MKFSTRQDIEAPAAAVFAVLTDFTALEVAGMRRGVRLRRLDGLTEPGQGMSWDLEFRFRARPRALIGSVVEYLPPERVVFEGVSAGYEITLALGLLALSKARTRLSADLLVRPRNLSARIMLQSARLARTSLARRYADRVQVLAEEVAARAMRMAAGAA